MFLAFANLLLSKYCHDVYKEKCTLLKEKYFRSTKKCCEAYSKNNPSENNGLEATNAIIKSHQTLRKIAYEYIPSQTSRKLMSTI